MKATYQTIKNKNIPLRLIKLNKIDEKPWEFNNVFF